MLSIPADNTGAFPGAIAPYRVSTEEYVSFRKNGYLVVRGLVAPPDIEELRLHTEDLMQGNLPEQKRIMERDAVSRSGTVAQDLAAPPPHLAPLEKAQYFVRIHMLHRRLELHERYLLHPRVLDVLEALIGPDILALQTMLFLKPPGKPGQGWHQDSLYIPTHPDTLCGAWIAIDDCDEINGAMWMAQGSGVEPIYPAPDVPGAGDTTLDGISVLNGISDPDDAANELTPIAARYTQVLITARAGDVVFFNGHVLHRSKMNHSSDRFRRAFVSHYCNARSFTQWGRDDVAQTPDMSCEERAGMTNGCHILARGDTHLPFARPRFGTPCAALLPAAERRRASRFLLASMAEPASGLMGSAPAVPEPDSE